MNFRKIEGLQDVFLEQLEGTHEWYFGKVAKDTFCDLFEAEEIAGMTGKFEGMNCALVHFPDGTVYRPFDTKENVYVEAPVFLNGMIYFLLVDFGMQQMQIISWNPANNEKSKIVELSLDEVKDCYNLRLIVAPLTLIRQGNEGGLEFVWPEKKEIVEELNEGLALRDGDDLYFSAWFEDPDYHEKVIVRDLRTGEIKESFDGQIQRMPNGDIWIL